MPLPDGVAIHIRNFKSFGADGGGYDDLKRINVVIGRNNSGKSALIDLIGYLCGGGDPPPRHYHAGRQSEIILSQVVTESAVRSGFPEGARGGHIQGDYWFQVGQHLVGHTFRSVRKGATFGYLGGAPGQFDIPESKGNFDAVVTRAGNPLAGKQFRRVAAERDVRPEQGHGTQIANNGDGLTRAVARIIHVDSEPSHLVERSMLRALNQVFAPDARYEGIIVQLVDADWEIFLIENGGVRVPLSSCGSGLKTVLHVLACLFLVPHFEQKAPGEYVYGFEELENNLHPALQRRRFAFLREWARTHDCVMFITTHSSAVIDMFAAKDDSTLTHVTRKDGVSYARTIKTYIDGRNLLDDLDVRASDLLQTNGLVWLEGPSDRIYFNKWIALISENQIQEGTAYQCVYYGGKLLAHLSAENPDAVAQEFVAALRINRNAVILMDSDKRSADGRTVEGRINATKRRVEDEFGRLGALAWITDGKEIENYIPHSVLKRMLGEAVPPLGQYEDIADYLETHRGVGEGEKYRRDKVQFARDVVDVMEADDLLTMPDLRGHIVSALTSIRQWSDHGEAP